MVINLFCDASINLEAKVACGGCLATLQKDDNTVEDIGIYGYIQQNATNNSAEILAIWTGVTKALSIRHLYPNAVFRLFSDSKISVYGIRDWIKSWIAKMNIDGVLISSSGQPVMNQQRFIDIYNIIVENRFAIEFYHQRGHVEDGRVSMDKARVQFIRANKCIPEALGLNMGYLCRCNSVIDNYTRDAIGSFLGNNTLLPGIYLEGIHPMEFIIRSESLTTYMHLIDKTTVKSRHDFKGGFSQ